MMMPRTCERFCARCRVESLIGRKGTTRTPPARRAWPWRAGMSAVPNAS
jgi:hypothetical protein